MSATKVTGSPARNRSRTALRNSSFASSPWRLPRIAIRVGAVLRSWKSEPTRPGTANSTQLRSSSAWIDEIRATSQSPSIGLTLMMGQRQSKASRSDKVDSFAACLFGQGVVDDAEDPIHLVLDLGDG
jgi:hypothetical protein